jgi:hypothetical protein
MVFLPDSSSLVTVMKSPPKNTPSCYEKYKKPLIPEILNNDLAKGEQYVSLMF